MANAKNISELSNTAKIQSQSILNESYNLIDRHDKFVNPSGVQSTDVAMKVDEVIIIFNYIITKDVKYDLYIYNIGSEIKY